MCVYFPFFFFQAPRPYCLFAQYVGVQVELIVISMQLVHSSLGISFSCQTLLWRP